MADELRDLLREFDEVMEDFDRGPTRQYEQHLEELKRKAGTRVYDSGIDELQTRPQEAASTAVRRTLTPRPVLTPPKRCEMWFRW
ncbi:uncharacterized protein LOC133222403 isoform X2 [Neopsephotus bourkii]|uniref:uncharacterized protein LOC133222403 isoform X2 n=1 Tax=Neopsephotus bourkii TaxID=309878 RepID=UPI002AA50497|nr:uncharacterized protein LOC133222403 isoform X2 [Neopsephotus bourkii]